jgi:hypothetical protein
VLDVKPPVALPHLHLDHHARFLVEMQHDHELARGPTAAGGTAPDLFEGRDELDETGPRDVLDNAVGDGGRAQGIARAFGPIITPGVLYSFLLDPVAKESRHNEC